MKALVSRSMKKKFYKAFPGWKDIAHNYVYHVGMITKKLTYFFWLESNNFTEAQKQFFVQNHIRTEAE